MLNGGFDAYNSMNSGFPFARYPRANIRLTCARSVPKLKLTGDTIAAMRASPTLLLVGVGAVIGIVIVAAAATADRRPVLASISPDPTMLRPRNYCIMNPFRDRLPERAADEFLRQLRDGHVTVLATTGGASREHLIENETKWPIEQWRIGRRKDEQHRVELMYWVRRGNGYSRDGYEEEVYMTVDRSRGPARVIQFSAIY
jgi:hypothetical protein